MTNNSNDNRIHKCLIENYVSSTTEGQRALVIYSIYFWKSSRSLTFFALQLLISIATYDHFKPSEIGYDIQSFICAYLH